MRLLCYAAVIALAVVLVWPGSKAGQAVQSVAGGLSSTLRSGQ
jgi:hypothetical protein